MKISIIQQSSLGDNDFDSMFAHGRKANKVIIVEHKGKSLQWNVMNKTWNSTDVETTNTSFDPINAYLESLPMAQQDAIFEKYNEIRSVLSGTSIRRSEGCEDLIETLRPLAVSLFDLIDPKHLHAWVWNQLKPAIPAKIEREFDPSTMIGTRERTYLLEDYLELIPLAIVIRMACPFWMDFVYLTDGSLSREYKDMHVFSIIHGSWPEQSRAMHRLREFVTHTVGNDASHPSAILAGISSDDFVDWALSYVVVTRLPIVDVMGTNSTAPVAPALFAAVRARVATITSGQPKITKKFTETTSNDDNNQSFLEGFRNRMALTIGQELTGSNYLLLELDRVMNDDPNPLGMIRRVAPDIDFALVRQCIESCSVLFDEYIIDEQVNIAAWLFDPYSQARVVNNLRKEETITFIGMAQAVFLHLGMIDFAILVSARYRSNELQSETVIGEQIAPIRANDRAEFAKNFPVVQKLRYSQNRNNQANTVIEDVQVIVRSLQNYDISCTFTKELNEKYREGNNNPRYSLRKDVAMMFMRFADYLASRPIIEIDPQAVYDNLVANNNY